MPRVQVIQVTVFQSENGKFLRIAGDWFMADDPETQEVMIYSGFLNVAPKAPPTQGLRNPDSQRGAGPT